MDIKFNIEAQTLTRLNESPATPASGSKNYLKCKFNFLTDDWKGLVKIASFKNEQGKEYNKYLGKGNIGECFVPYDVLKGDYFRVSVYGGDLITTNEVVLTLVSGGYTRNKECNQDIYVDIYDEIDTKASKEEINDYYAMLNEKVDKDCFDINFDNRMIVWLQDLADGINEL